MLKKHNRLSTILALVLAAIMLAGTLAMSGCSEKKEEIEIPDGLTREEAALYLALAYVCPKANNHSKAEFLTFRFEGWSFEELPKAIEEYIQEYCKAGNAELVMGNDEWLKMLGLLQKGEQESYYEGQTVYAEGKGAIFTFSLGEDQNIESDSVKVSMKKFISDVDTSGYDVELNYASGGWKIADPAISGVWNNGQLQDADSTPAGEPQK